MNKNLFEFSSRSLLCKSYDNAMVIPTHHPHGGMIDKNGNFIFQSGITEEWCPCHLPDMRKWIKFSHHLRNLLHIIFIHPRKTIPKINVSFGNYGIKV